MHISMKFPVDPAHRLLSVLASSRIPNASGLSPRASKALTERQADESEAKIVSAIKQLYRCRPSESSYDVYAQDAVFQDPVGVAEGIESIKARFNGLMKMFARIDVLKFRVLAKPQDLPPGTLLIDQDVAYYCDPSSCHPTKTLNSLLTICMNENSQIVRHTEEWFHMRDLSRQDNFVRMLESLRNKLSAVLTESSVQEEAI